MATATNRLELLRRKRQLQEARLRLVRPKNSLINYARWTMPSYQVSWHHQEQAKWLERLERREIKRLMVFEPPRHGKSEMSSVRYPAFSLGRSAEKQFIITSYAGTLAKGFSRACREVVRSESHQMLWPSSFRVDQDARWMLVGKENQRMNMIAAGVGGSLSGEGATDFIIDDPVKDAEEASSIAIRDKHEDWYQAVARTRLQPDAVVLLQMTRWHEDDLAGRLLRKALENPDADQWIVLCLPATNVDGNEAYVWDTSTGEKTYFPAYDALWPEAYDAEYWQSTKASVSVRVWNALYQQRPSAQEGGIIKRHWFRRFWSTKVHKITLWGQEFVTEVLPEKLEKQNQSWDMTFKDTQASDFVVGQVWGYQGASNYLLDQVRERMDFARTCQAVKETSAKFPATLEKLVEDKANGPAVISALKGAIPGFVPIEPQGSKEARLSAASTYYEANNVVLPDPTMPGFRWVHDFVEEHCAFPNGLFDDQCDAASQALNRRTMTSRVAVKTLRI